MVGGFVDGDPKPGDRSPNLDFRTRFSSDCSLIWSEDINKKPEHTHIHLPYKVQRERERERDRERHTCHKSESEANKQIDRRVRRSQWQGPMLWKRLLWPRSILTRDGFFLRKPDGFTHFSGFFEQMETSSHFHRSWSLVIEQHLAIPSFMLEIMSTNMMLWWKLTDVDTKVSGPRLVDYCSTLELDASASRYTAGQPNVSWNLHSVQCYPAEAPGLENLIFWYFLRRNLFFNRRHETWLHDGSCLDCPSWISNGSQVSTTQHLHLDTSSYWGWWGYRQPPV